jgi:hypothetical protein
MYKLRVVQSLALVAVLGGFSSAAAAPQQPARVPWKPVAMALLRVDDAPPKNWQVYRSEKRKQFILVQMGARFLLADLESRRVFELAAHTLTRTKEALEWADPGDPPASPSANSAAPAASTASAAKPASVQRASQPDSAKPAKLLLASSDWSMRDVGPAMRIRFRLTDEGRDFDVQFPIQPDLRQFY